MYQQPIDDEHDEKGNSYEDNEFSNALRSRNLFDLLGVLNVGCVSLCEVFYIAIRIAFELEPPSSMTVEVFSCLGSGDKVILGHCSHNSLLLQTQCSLSIEDLLLNKSPPKGRHD